MIADNMHHAVQQQKYNSSYADQKKQDTADKYGQLGLGHKHLGKNYTIPKICCYNLVIRTVSCGEEHSAFITQRGHIYTIGSNEDGKLGISTRSIQSSSTPCLVEELSKVKCLSISCGSSHTVAVMQNGEVYGWGDGSYGQLGNGTNEACFSPTRIVSENKEFIQGYCGSRHTILIDLKKNVFVCGSNENGQLGLRNTKMELFVKRLEIKGIIEAACGQFHSLLLDEVGRVYGAGANSFGQLGLGIKNTFYEFTYIQSLEGEQIVKVSAGSNSAALNRKGDIFIWGTGVFGEYLLPFRIQRNSSGTPFSDISVGNFFSAAVDINGAVWTWGNNSNGELGQGDYESKTTPQLLQALKGRHVQKVCCGGGFAMALGNKIPKENKQNPNDSVIKQQTDKSNYQTSQSQQALFVKQELPILQDQNSLQKNYSTSNNLISNKPHIDQNYSPFIEKNNTKIKDNSPLQKSLHTEKKPSSQTTVKKSLKSDASPTATLSKNNVQTENNNSSSGLDKKRKYSVENLCHAYKVYATQESKKSNNLSSSIDQRQASLTKNKKKQLTPSTSAKKKVKSIKKDSCHLNKENDEPISSKRFSKKQQNAVFEFDEDQIERFNKKIVNLEKKLNKETNEKQQLKEELNSLKETLEDIQFGKNGLNNINETMESQQNNLLLLQKEYDKLLQKYAEKEQQVNSLIAEIKHVKEELIKKDQEIFSLKDEISLLSDDKKNGRRNQNQFENLIKKLQTEISDYQVQSNSYKNVTDTYRQEIESLRREVENQKENEQNERRAREELQRQNELLKKEIETFRSKLEDSHFENEGYLTELRRIKKEKEQDNINYMQLEDNMRQLDHDKKKIIIERNNAENELMNFKERVQASERQEQIAEKKIQELSQIKQTYEYDNDQLKHEMNIKVSELNTLNDRVSILTQKLQQMEDKNTQLSVLLNYEIDKQAMQFKQGMENNSQLFNSAEKKPISTTDLILNNQFSASSKKSYGRQLDKNFLTKSLIYSDNKQFEDNNKSDILRSDKQRSKSIDTSFNLSQKSGSISKNKQNVQFSNTNQNNSELIQTQPFDLAVSKPHKSLDNLNDNSHISGAEKLLTFSDYNFSNTKNKQNPVKQSLNNNEERYSSTPEQGQKNLILVQENYEQKSQPSSIYKVRSASAQKLLNLIERTGENSVKQDRNISPLRKTPERSVRFQSGNQQHQQSYSPFGEQDYENQSNKKQNLEQINEEKSTIDQYESQDLLELTNVRQRLEEMRRTKDMVFSRMMDFDQKIKKFTEQQEKLLNKK